MEQQYQNKTENGKIPWDSLSLDVFNGSPYAVQSKCCKGKNLKDNVNYNSHSDIAKDTMSGMVRMENSVVIETNAVAN